MWLTNESKISRCQSGLMASPRVEKKETARDTNDLALVVVKLWNYFKAFIGCKKINNEIVGTVSVLYLCVPPSLSLSLTVLFIPWINTITWIM